MRLDVGCLTIVLFTAAFAGAETIPKSEMEWVSMQEIQQALRSDSASAERAANALVKMGPKAERALPDLITALTYDDPQTAKAVQEALVAIGQPAVSPLVKALGDFNFLVRQRAATTLGVMRENSSRVVMALTTLLNDRSYEVQSAAEFALKQAGEPGVIAVSAAMRREQGTNRKIYVDLLPKLGPSATPALLGVLLKDENAYLRASAAAGLASIRPVAKETVPALARSLTDLQEVVRAQAADSLGELKEESRAAMGLLTVLASTDSDPLVRQKASQALVAIGPADAAALPGLIAAFRHEQTDVKTSALRQVIHSSVPYADIQGITQTAFQDGNPNIRLALIEALGQSSRRDSPEAQVILNAALKDNAPHVRIAAEAALHPAESQAHPSPRNSKTKGVKKKR